MFWVGDILRLEEMTSDEFADFVDRLTVVVLPIGAVEEHGWHLPLNTDTIQPEKIAWDVEKILEKDNYKVLIAPTLNYGNCRTTANFPGTISITPDSLRSVVRDILTEFMRHGLKNIVVLSGHAGGNHMAALRMAAEDALKNGNARIMVLSDYDIAYRHLGEEVPKDDGHGGMLETSRVMAIRPDLVKLERSQGESHPELPPYRILKNPERYFTKGYRGYPDMANEELGRKMNRMIAEELAKLIEEMIDEELVR